MKSLQKSFRFTQRVILIFALFLLTKINFAQYQLIQPLSMQEASDEFSHSVSGAGDVNGDGYNDIIVGAPGYSSYTGRVYIYYGGKPMNSEPDVILTGENSMDMFGGSVSCAGDVNNDGFDDVIVGNTSHTPSRDRVYIYFGGSVMDDTADVIMLPVSFSFGCSVSGAGDVNGDGYDDVIIGASSSSRAYIYFGGSSMDNDYDIQLQESGLSSGGLYFGCSVSGAGDVNGDGYDDVLVGSYGDYSPYRNQGHAFIFYGGSSMSRFKGQDVTLTGEGLDNYFGFSVSGTGDVNNDGYDDVIVGAYGFNYETGIAYIYYGGSSMDHYPDVIFPGEEYHDYFGYSVSGLGDVNKDGINDVIIGAPEYSSNNGRAYIYYGSNIDMDNTVDCTIDGDGISEYFGRSVSGAGDMNNDGYVDAIIGNWYSHYSNSKAFIYTWNVGDFVVNTTDDSDDGVCNEEHCSLREAINATNADVNGCLYTIKFNIPGTGPQTIHPLSPLPELTNPVIIDGTTQPGYSGAPIIEIDGSNITDPANGLTVSGGNTTIKGLVINNFTTTGIFLNINGGNIVQSNYLGTDVTGTIAKPNKEAGVKVHNVPNNLIGGLLPTMRNLISGNDWNGVWIDSPDSKNNIVQRNFIGTTSNGLGALPNGDFGIKIHNASDNIIGGSPGGRNIISGNGYEGYADKGHGVLIEYCGPNANNCVSGNYIGTDKTGMTALPNTWGGISILNAPDNIIGPGNVISGNENAGIYIWNYLPDEMKAARNIVRGNLIGTNAEGTGAIPNEIGIFIGSSWENRIGGIADFDKNIISGNLKHGIEIKYAESHGNKIFGNYIGTAHNGTAALGNGFSHPLNLGSGIFIWDAPSTKIGKNEYGLGNLISGNEGNGIYLIGGETINTQICNNKIGIDISYHGNPLPNSINGVLIDWLDDGSVDGAAKNTLITLNEIAFNTENGIDVAHGEQNLISENSIFSNGILGIDLGNDGVTANDYDDSDPGPNNLQNYPVIDEAIPSENVIVEGSLNSSPNTEYNIEFFKNNVRDNSLYGEGKTFLGKTIVYTNNNGDANFEVELEDAQAGDIITSTATDPVNNTSEFSRGKTVKLPVLTANPVIEPLTSSFSSANIPPNLSSAMFQSTWPGSDIVMTLTTPSGLVINRTTIPLPTGVTYGQTPTSEIFIITDPENGKWGIELFGKDVGDEGEAAKLFVAGEPENPVNTVCIDVQPGEDVGTINCTDKEGVVPVAVLSTEEFDVTQLDHTTVRFGACGSEAIEYHTNKKGLPQRHEEDIDGDGDLDLVLHFLFKDTGIKCKDEYAVLTGFTYDGKMVRGTDKIRTVGENKLTKENTTEAASIPKEFKLYNAYPNPFNYSAIIRYELPNPCFVNIEVYNILGQRLSVLKSDYMEPGYYKVLFDGKNLASGTYIYKIQAGNFIEIKKMVLMK